MKTFLFCIGGSGARALKSLSMLLATGIEVKTDEIIPILIDLDEQNGDFRRASRILTSYKNISNILDFKSGYFSTKINTLEDDLELQFADSNKTFGDYLSVQRLSQLNRDFLTSLFDASETSSPKAELNLKMDLGFQGNPNIGSIVFHDLKNSEAYKAFEGQVTQGDKIVIVSSIFGGTGSSGFPQLVRIIKESNNIPVNSAEISAIIIQPYFQVKEDKNSSINSDLFNSKTKAALGYYIQNLQADVNRFYLLADRPGNPIDNIKGGNRQENKAHFIELLAATGIIHAVNKGKEGNSKFYEFGIKDLRDPERNLQAVDFKDFHDNSRWERLLKFSYFAKFYLHGLAERTKETFFIQLNLKKQLIENPFFTELFNFLKEYWIWLEEMSQSQRSFDPFNLNIDAPFSLYLKGSEYKGLDKKSGVMGFGAKDFFSGEFLNQLNEMENDGSLNIPQKFVRAASRVFDKMYSDYIVSLPHR